MLNLLLFLDQFTLPCVFVLHQAAAVPDTERNGEHCRDDEQYDRESVHNVEFYGFASTCKALFRCTYA